MYVLYNNLLIYESAVSNYLSATALALSRAAV